MMSSPMLIPLLISIAPNDIRRTQRSVNIRIRSIHLNAGRTGTVRQVRRDLQVLGVQIESSALLLLLLSFVHQHYGDNIHTRLGILLAAMQLLDNLRMEEDCLVTLLDVVAILLSDLEAARVTKKCRIKIREVGDLKVDECLLWTCFTKDQLYDLLPLLCLPNISF